MAKQAPLYQALAARGFETAGLACYGLWKGYAVTLLLEQGSYWAHFAVRVNQSDRSLQKALAASMKNACGRRVAVNLALGRGKTAAFAFRADRKSPCEDQFAAFADNCVRALQENGLSPAKTCAVCGGGTPESLCLLGSYQPVHSGCMRSSLEKTREQAADNQANGSYLTGLVGALLGMLVGLIPNIAIGVLSDRIYAVLFALVPLAAMWCYRKFNGKMSKGSIGIIIVVSLLGVVVMQFFTLAIYIVQEYGVSLGKALSLSLQLFGDGEVLGSVLGSSVMHFVFMALGILFAWRYLNQTNGGNVANMEAALATLRPNPDFSGEDVEL